MDIYLDIADIDIPIPVHSPHSSIMHCRNDEITNFAIDWTTFDIDIH